MTRDNERLFNRIHSNADIHSYRRDYAQKLYEDILKDHNFKALRNDVFIITNALGHNRLDVAINHYLR